MHPQKKAFSQIQSLFWLFGLIPMYTLTAPIFLFSVATAILPRSLLFTLLHLSGLLTGFFLVGGAIAVLPNVYWKICFFFDIFVLAIFSASDSYRNEELLTQVQCCLLLG